MLGTEVAEASRTLLIPGGSCPELGDDCGAGCAAGAVLDDGAVETELTEF